MPNSANGRSEKSESEASTNFKIKIQTYNGILSRYQKNYPLRLQHSQPDSLLSRFVMSTAAHPSKRAKSLAS